MLYLQDTCRVLTVVGALVGGLVGVFVGEACVVCCDGMRGVGETGMAVLFSSPSLN
jgi:hypothetical protein